MRRIFATVLALGFAAIPACGSPSSAQPEPHRRSETQMFTCDRPAPTTPEGYQDLWASLNPDEWGASDVHLPIRMPNRDGRATRVWLYGDTMSNGGRMVHSSAITQVGGCLKVSRGGAQLLPNAGDGSIFWILDAWRVPDTDRLIRVKARSTMLTGEEGMWGFRDNGYFRQMTVKLQDDGNVVFVTGSMSAKQFTPEPPSDAVVANPGETPVHWHYFFRTLWKLPDGRTLKTHSQNWEGPLQGGWANYRPVFYA